MPSPELERSLKIKERLENSLGLKKLLLMLVLAGTSMVIADGVVTPAMSGANTAPCASLCACLLAVSSFYYVITIRSKADVSSLPRLVHLIYLCLFPLSQ